MYHLYEGLVSKQEAKKYAWMLFWLLCYCWASLTAWMTNHCSIIGVSVSEPHIDEFAVKFLCNICVVSCAKNHFWLEPQTNSQLQRCRLGARDPPLPLTETRTMNCLPHQGLVRMETIARWGAKAFHEDRESASCPACRVHHGVHSYEQYVVMCLLDCFSYVLSQDGNLTGLRSVALNWLWPVMTQVTDGPTYSVALSER